MAFATKFIGDQAAPNGDDCAESTNKSVGVATVELPALDDVIPDVWFQKFVGVFREDKFASKNKVGELDGETEAGAMLLPIPSAKTPETPSKKTAKPAVAPAQKRNI